MLTAQEQLSRRPGLHVPMDTGASVMFVTSDTENISVLASSAAHVSGSSCAAASRIGMSSSIPPIISISSEGSI